MSLLRKSISAAATTIMVAAAAALLGVAGMVAAGYKPQVVVSGSMRPMLDRGSVVFVKPTPAGRLRVGQVITFQNPIKGGDHLVTHRIVATRDVKGRRAFVTKGDANLTRDPWRAEIPGKAGVLKAQVPYVGRISFLVHSRNGYVALFVVPLFLLAGMVLWQIWMRPERPPEELAYSGVPGAQGVAGLA